MNSHVTVEQAYLDELKQKSHQLETLLDTTPNPIIHTHLSGEIYQFNQAAAKVFQISSSAALGTNLFSYFPCADLENKGQLFLHHGEAGAKKDFETEYILPDGTTLVFDVSLTLDHDLQEHPMGWCAVIRDISGKNESERKLQESNRKIRSVFRAAPIGIGVTVNRVLTEVNDTFCAMLGYSREDIVGSEARCLYPTEEEYQFVGTAKYAMIRQQGTGTLETRMVCKSGEILDVLMSSTPLDPKDWSKGVTFTVLDITDRKRAEQRVRSSEEYFRSLMEQLPVGVAIYDMTGTLERMNKSFMSNWNLPEKLCDYIKGRFNLFQSSEIQQLGLDGLVERAFNGEVVHVPPIPADPRPFLPDIDFAFDGGEYGWLVIHFYPMRDEDGNLQRIISVHEDVTDYILAEEKLASKARTLDAIFNATPSILMLVDEELRVEKINQHGAIFSGQDIRSADGRFGGEVLNCTSFNAESPCRDTPTCSICPVHTKVRETFSSGTSHKKELGRMPFFINGANRFHDILISTARIDIDGSHRVLLSITDVTSVREKELELRREREERNKLEQQVRQSQKMESIGRLAGGIAHDLNNLLSPILGYGEILVEDLAKADPRRNSAQQIVNAGVRAGDLVRQLLAFSRKQKLDYKAVDINLLYTKFMPLLRRAIREDIDIKDNLAKQLPVVRGDIGQLEQVVMNLCINAQDAMPDGGQLFFETRTVELGEWRASLDGNLAPGWYVLLSVTDSGGGMDEATRSKIFEPFFTTKGKNQGTGLGLATVYGIVSQHGGTIYCNSRVGMGTTFEVYLPVSAEIAEFTGDPRPEEEIASGKGETILLVEDNEQLRSMAEFVLTRNGYKVLSAANGGEALELCRVSDRPCKLLLTDIVMPELNGRELAEKVCTLYPRIKVLYMSGYPDDILALKGGGARELPYLHKPFTVNGLLRNVRQALHNKEGDGA